MDLVTGVLGSLVSKLSELLKEEYHLQAGLRKKIMNLSRDLESMHVVLRKVAEVPPEQLDEEVKLWARDIRELSYKAEDALDQFLVRVDGPQARNPKWLKRATKMIRNLKVRHKIGNMIKSINEQVNEVDKRHRRYKAGDIVSKPASTSTVDPRLKAIYTDVTQLVGIEQPCSALISMLSLSSGENMKMVSIVGAGGLGKTTLAKAVYDEFISRCECGTFVSVGRNPDIPKVLRELLMNLDKNKYMMNCHNFASLSVEQLIGELQEFLGTKRYLLVIDDIWEITSWETIKLALVKKKEGSRVITTTRILEVAIGVGEVYNIEKLPYSISKKLFYMRIFGAEEKCPDNQLDEVSDKILEKCDGVPLAIITMASLLVGKSKEEWNEVCCSIAFHHDKDNKQVNDTEWILSLSYYDLPPHLKTCLLYLCVFPEDCVINKHSLLWKWVAEGFVIMDKPGSSLFEVAEKYFNDLINRSMIQAVESEDYGMVVGCRVHDMVLDLLYRKSMEENFITLSSNAEGMVSPIESSKVRRLAHHKRVSNMDDHKDNLNLRSLIAYNCDYVGLSLISFKLLRVLALENCKGTGNYIDLEHLDSLLHLRYLGLRGTSIKELPEEIGSLKFLQTLEVDDTAVGVLPSSIGKLTQLTYLDVCENTVPEGVMEKLTSLEELHLRTAYVRQFVVELCKLTELRVLKAYIRNIDGKIIADLLGSIAKLHKIRHLELHSSDCTVPASSWSTGMLSGHLQCLIAPHLTFCGAMPACINRSDLPKLTHLNIDVSQMEGQQLEMLGQLPELCYLKLRISSKTAPKVTAKTSTAAGCAFKKLKYCQLYHSTVQFVVNEDSSVSFTIWNGTGRMASGSEKGEHCNIAPAIMPKLEELAFGIQVRRMTDMNWNGENLGLECLPSLQKLKVNFLTMDTNTTGRKMVKGALTSDIEVHPNRPTMTFLYFSAFSGLYSQL